MVGRGGFGLGGGGGGGGGGGWEGGDVCCCFGRGGRGWGVLGFVWVFGLKLRTTPFLLRLLRMDLGR